MVDALIAHGRVEGRPTIGITGYTVTEELAEEYGCPRGVAVQSVREGSDAQRQGVLPNDVIVAVNGETITDMDQLQAIKEGLAVGDVLTFRLWRGGHYLEPGRGPGGPVHAGGVDKKRAPRPGAPKRDVCGRMEESRVGITLAYWISCALIIL